LAVVGLLLLAEVWSCLEVIISLILWITLAEIAWRAFKSFFVTPVLDLINAFVHPERSINSLCILVVDVELLGGISNG
jgi:hypothetical protein